MAMDYTVKFAQLRTWKVHFLVQVVISVLIFEMEWFVSCLGSMSSIAMYDENGFFCRIKPDGTHIVSCFGSNSAVVYGTPPRIPFSGLTAGDSFVCGLLLASKQPYCWGTSILVHIGVPRPMDKGSEYLEISAGDFHLCGLRMPFKGRMRNVSLVDCWGYNMTKTYVFDGQIQSISAGSLFNCSLFSQNRSIFCWGDKSTSPVIRLTSKGMRFQDIAAGGYHVCGILEGVNSRAFCRGTSMDSEEKVAVAYSAGQGSVYLPPSDPILSIVGGKFHASGVRSFDRGVICWGFRVPKSTPTPKSLKVYQIAAGDYFSCGILTKSRFCLFVGV